MTNSTYPIRYKDYISNRPAGQIESVFIAGTNGPDFAIRLKGRGGDGIQFDLVLVSNAVRFVADLEPMVQRMKRTLSDARQSQVEHFSRPPGNGRRMADPSAPLELRAHAYDWLTMDQLTGIPDVDFGLIGLRFPHLADTIDPKQIRAAERYLAGADDLPGDGQFENDLATLQLMPPAALTKSSGEINLSAVARAVNRRTGGSDWSYVQDLAAALGAAWAEEKAA